MTNLDPAAALPEAQRLALLEAERALLRERKATLLSLWHLVTDTLGVSPERVMEARDPHVRDCVSRYDAHLNNWLMTRERERTTGQRILTQPTKIMYVMPRGCMKSSIVTGGTPIKAHLWESEIAMALSSGNHEKMAVPFGKMVKSHWEAKDEHNKLVDLFGPFAPGGGRPWREEAYETIQRQGVGRNVPTLKIFSVQTGGTSGHYDLVILDDPITQEMVEKEGDRWMTKCWKHYESLGYVLNPNGLFVLVCTRYGDNDMVGQIVEREIEPIIREKTWLGKPEGELPDDWAEDEGWIKYAHRAGWNVIYERAWDGDIFSQDEKDFTLYFPTIWSQDRIVGEIRKSELTAMCQLQNRPAARSDSHLNSDQIEACWIDASDVPKQAYTRLTMHCDLAWKSQENYMAQKGDFNVVQIWGHHAGHVYLLWGSRGKWTADLFRGEWIRGLQWAEMGQPGIRPRSYVRIMTYDKPLGQDTGSTVRDQFLSWASAEGIACPAIFEVSRHGKNKTERIIATTGFWQDGRVHMVRGVVGSKELADQMLKIGYSSHDDDADAAADVFGEHAYAPARRLDVSAVGRLDGAEDWVPLCDVRPNEPIDNEPTFEIDLGHGRTMRV